MSEALSWYVGFWLAHGADAGPWLAGLCVVLGVGFLLLAVAVRGAQRLLTVGLLALGGTWLVTRVAALRRRSRRKRPDFYRWYLGSAAWELQRVAALRRAGFRCARCQASVPLDVHHLTYERLGREAPADLVALCRRCHQAAHAGDRAATGTRRTARPKREVAWAPRIPAQKYAPRKRGR